MASRTLAPLRWGEWELNRENFTLVHRTGYGYAVDLEKCSTSARVLDRIAQIQQKRWASRKTVGQLVEALNDLLGFQSNLCPFGHDKTISRERVRELVRANELEVRATRELKRQEAEGEVPWRRGDGLLVRTDVGAYAAERARLVEHFRALRDDRR